MIFKNYVNEKRDVGTVMIPFGVKNLQQVMMKGA